MAKHLTPAEEAARFGRLPQWAQQKMLQQIARAERAEKELDELRSGAFGPEDTDTFVESWADRAPLNLPKGAAVTYVLGYGSEDTVRVSIRHHGELEVMGHGGISVEPQATNVVAIKMRGR